MASQGEVVCVLEGIVCGHHVYKATWTPTVGEILAVRQEPGNDHDRHAVCIKVADSDGSLYHWIGLIDVLHTSHELFTRLFYHYYIVILYVNSKL